MFWIFITLLTITSCMILYVTLGTILILKLFKWLSNRNKDKQIEKEMEEFREWDVTLMDGLEEDEWDNKHHNENI